MATIAYTLLASTLGAGEKEKLTQPPEEGIALGSTHAWASTLEFALGASDSVVSRTGCAAVREALDDLADGVVAVGDHRLGRRVERVGVLVEIDQNGVSISVPWDGGGVFGGWSRLSRVLCGPAGVVR
jgi:hypothetical protein